MVPKTVVLKKKVPKKHPLKTATYMEKHTDPADTVFPFAVLIFGPWLFFVRAFHQGSSA